MREEIKQTNPYPAYYHHALKAGDFLYEGEEAVGKGVAAHVQEGIYQMKVVTFGQEEMVVGWQMEEVTFHPYEAVGALVPEDLEEVVDQDVVFYLVQPMVICTHPPCNMIK